MLVHPAVNCNVNSNESSYGRNCNIHQHNTREAQELILPFSRLTVGQNSPTYINKCLNKLSCVLENLNSKDLKANAQSFLSVNAFYSVQEFLNFKIKFLTELL